MPEDVAAELQEIYPQLLAAFHRVLDQHGFGHVAIDEIGFVSREGLYLKTDGCPPGTQSKQVCVSRPGGGIRCFTVCLPARQQP